MNQNFRQSTVNPNSGQGKKPFNGDGKGNSNFKLPDFNSKDLLGNEAERLAEEITRSKKLTTSQIRNFYSEVKNIENLLKANNNLWEKLYGRIKLIKAKAIYNANRGQKSLNISKEFKEFICQAIDKITPDENGKKNFTIFCQLFEAVVGYSSAYISPEKDKKHEDY
jgi:CRISPR type III-A-associated protein Csm2